MQDMTTLFFKLSVGYLITIVKSYTFKINEFGMKVKIICILMNNSRAIHQKINCIKSV